MVSFALFWLVACGGGAPSAPTPEPAPPASPASPPQQQWSRRPVPAAPPWAIGAYRFLVVEPSRARNPAGVSDDPAAWDKTFLDRFAITVEGMLGPATFSKLERATDDYAAVLGAVRAKGLPDALAAIPYQESYYFAKRRRATDCAAGIWQLRPDRAVGVAALHGLPMKIEGCTVEDGDESREVSGADLVTGPRCLLSDDGCLEDDRLDRDKATAVALAELSDAWSRLGGTPSGVVLTVLSHPLGLDDGRYPGGATREGNLLPVWSRWAGNPATFYGENMTCSSPMQPGTCGGLLGVNEQTYAVMVVAYHAVAACYYARFHGDVPVFAPRGELSYCDWLKIPEEKAQPAEVVE